MDIVTYALLKKQISGITPGFSYKGSVADEEDLPANPEKGDLYTVTGEDNAQYVWDGEDWIRLGNDSGKTKYVTLSGTIITQTGADNTMYLCGELTELTFTVPETGITAIRFTSGTTPTVVTLTGITMPDDWEGAEASTTYEINVLNGYGVWQAWT